MEKDIHTEHCTYSQCEYGEENTCLYKEIKFKEVEW